MYTEHIFNYEGINTKYYTYGHGDPLLLLHGVGLSHKTYNKAIELLSKKYLIIAPDLPGFGSSDLPKTVWSFKDYGYWLNGLINQLSIESITIIGISFSGAIAIETAAINNKIKKLLLISPTGLPPAYPYWKIWLKLLFEKNWHNAIYYNGLLPMIGWAYDFLTNIAKHGLQTFHLEKMSRTATFKGLSLKNKVAIPTTIMSAQKDERFPANRVEGFSEFIASPNYVTVNEYHDWPCFKPELMEEFI